MLNSQLSKQNALRTLITHSIVFDAEQKQELLGRVDQLTAEEVDALGVFLANEQNAIDEVLEEQVLAAKNALTLAEKFDAQARED